MDMITRMVTPNTITATTMLVITTMAMATRRSRPELPD
jgi:hypothetical protein